MKRSLQPLTVAVIIAAGALAAIPTYATTSNMVINQFSGHKFQADYTNRTFSGAKNDCIAKGGYLAVISSIDDYSAIYSVVAQNPTVNYTLGEWAPINSSDPHTVTGEAYYQGSEMWFQTILGWNHSAPLFLEYTRLSPPLADHTYAFNWVDSVNHAYICEWDS